MKKDICKIIRSIKWCMFIKFLMKEFKYTVEIYSDPDHIPIERAIYLKNFSIAFRYLRKKGYEAYINKSNYFTKFTIIIKP